MGFYGQSKIVEELLGFVERIKKGENYNFLLNAGSGQGKTLLAKTICELIDPNIFHTRIYSFPLKAKFSFNTRYRLNILDEVHRTTEPEELYPYMDSGKYVFILLSNLKGKVVEPLRNRCISYTFEEYSESEIQGIVKETIESKGMILPDSFYLQIAIESNLNPRVAKTDLSARLVNLFGLHGIPKNIDELKLVLKDRLGVINGLNEECREYLRFLGSREYSSLDTISAYLQQPSDYVKYDIEPILIRRGLIEITSKGRTLVQVKRRTL